MAKGKIPMVFIILAVLIIAVVIIVWLMSRKTEANGGEVTNGHDPLREDHIELERVDNDRVSVYFYDHIRMGEVGMYFDKFALAGVLSEWHDDNRINSIQYEDGMNQLQNILRGLPPK